MQRAHRRGLLRGIARRAVILRESGDHHLRVALRPERPGLEKRLSKVHAPRVDVQTRVDVIERVHDDVQTGPKRVVEHVLGVRGDAILQRDDVELRVDRLGRVGRAVALRLADVPVAEQKLPREVRLFDDVVVRDRDFPFFAAAEPHEREVLDELAPERARADEEDLLFLDLPLKRAAEARDLRVVPAPFRGHLLRRERLDRRQRLHGVEVEPLKQRVKLPRARLHHLLADDAAEHRAHRRDAPARRLREERQHAVRVHVIQLRARGRGRVELVRDGDDRGGVRVVPGLRELAAVRRGELFERGEPEVQRGRPLEFGKVGQEELPGVRHRVLQRLELQRLRLLHLRRDPAAGVRAVRRRVLFELERVRLDVFYFPRLSVVEFGHPSHLREDHGLPVLELDAVVVHARHHRRRLVAHARYDARVRLLAVRVRDVKRRAEVAEERSEDASNVAANERDPVVVAEGVDRGRPLERNVRADDHLMLRAERVGDLVRDDGDRDRGVELLEPPRARGRAVRADVRLGEVKLRAQI
mmetsp:Transcript_892/g.2930  ORF Transcript_892/g.2930 Transcript_892/m.2930 type:complete len:529 (-) Transcript_892:351-1937(-)